ncbi:HAMP domain-containing sensor histidine kinase [Streptomyces sp. NPDC006237]|uniref:sensor histidine kinase n=1 Tax=Streptomyces sp. NPDC006237 TaxID=3154474 RepID=UPI00339DF645
MRQRLVVMLVALPTLVLGVLGVPLAMDRAQEAVRQLAAERLEEAHRFAEPAVRALREKEHDPLREKVAHYQDATGGRAQVFDIGAELVTGAVCILTPAELAERREVRAALAGRVTDSSAYTLSWQAKELIVAVPLIDGGQLIGAVVICSALEDLRLELVTVWVLLGVVAVLALAANGFLAEPLARWVLRPIRALESAARAFAAGTHSARAPADAGPEELRVLAGTFNAMAERLEQQVKAQKAFIADASHQLRGPLVALRLRLENLEPYLSDEGGPGLEHALAEADRMGRILSALLTLARCEGRSDPPRAVDALAVAEERAAAWRLVADGRDVSIEVGGDEALAAAIPGTLDQILDVFVDNALAVAPAHSTVRLAVRGDGRGVRVSCQDQGPGMSAEDRRRACDRFWRGPRAAAGEGSGLGLAIASSLARASGGELLLDDAPGGGLKATVVLPSWPAQEGQGGEWAEPCIAAA